MDSVQNGTETDVVDPGETDSSIGFCANRTTSGGSLPTVISTSATL